MRPYRIIILDSQRASGRLCWKPPSPCSRNLVAPHTWERSCMLFQGSMIHGEKHTLLLDTTQTLSLKLVVGWKLETLYSYNSSTIYKIMNFATFVPTCSFFKECAHKRYDACSPFLWCTQATQRVVSFGISSKNTHKSSSTHLQSTSFDLKIHWYWHVRHSNVPKTFTTQSYPIQGK